MRKPLAQLGQEHRGRFGYVTVTPRILGSNFAILNNTINLDPFTSRSWCLHHRTSQKSTVVKWVIITLGFQLLYQIPTFQVQVQLHTLSCASAQKYKIHQDSRLHHTQDDLCPNLLQEFKTSAPWCLSGREIKYQVHNHETCYYEPNGK